MFLRQVLCFCLFVVRTMGHSDPIFTILPIPGPNITLYPPSIETSDLPSRDTGITNAPTPSSESSIMSTETIMVSTDGSILSSMQTTTLTESETLSARPTAAPSQTLTSTSSQLEIPFKTAYAMGIIVVLVLQFIILNKN